MQVDKMHYDFDEVGDAIVNQIETYERLFVDKYMIDMLVVIAL